MSTNYFSINVNNERFFSIASYILFSIIIFLNNSAVFVIQRFCLKGYYLFLSMFKLQTNQNLYFKIYKKIRSYANVTFCKAKNKPICTTSPNKKPVYN